MSQLNIKLNLSTRHWTIQEVDISSKYIDVRFGFTNTTKPTSTTSDDLPKFEGMRGFYKKHFPLLQQYFY